MVLGLLSIDDWVDNDGDMMGRSNNSPEPWPKPGRNYYYSTLDGCTPNHPFGGPMVISLRPEQPKIQRTGDVLQGLRVTTTIAHLKDGARCESMFMFLSAPP